MLKRIAVAMIATFAALFVVDRTSLLIAPCGEYSSAEGNQKPADNDNCTVREGIIVAGIERLRETPPDVWTALATIAIATFTLTLWLSTEKMWEVTKRSTEIAERALTELEAPFVVVKITAPGFAKPAGLGVTYMGQVPINFSFINYGRTPALMLECFEDLISIPIGSDLPPERNPVKQRSAPLPYGIVAGPGGGESQEFSYRFTPDGDGTHNFKTNAVYFVGVVRYSNIFGESYTQGFCFLYDDRSVEWINAGDENWSYCRKDKKFYSPPGAKT
jgi:hypothetical protein